MSNAFRLTRAGLEENDEVDITKHPIIATYNFRAIQDSCAFAQKRSRVMGLIGEAGYGKSVALDYYQRNNKNVIMVTVKPSMAAKTFWLELMLSACGMVNAAIRAEYNAKGREEYVSDYFRHNTFDYDHKSLYQIFTKNIEAFKMLENPLLIIDEAGKFKNSQLLDLHELRDGTRNHLGIILAGPGYFQRNLNKMATREVPGIRELLTRIQYWHQLEKPKPLELRKVAEALGLKDADKLTNIVSRVNNYRELYNEVTNELL